MKTTKQTRVRKVPIKTTENFNSQVTHSNFAEEIQSKEKSDKFFNRITIVLAVVAVVLLAMLIINNV